MRINESQSNKNETNRKKNKIIILCNNKWKQKESNHTDIKKTEEKEEEN